MDFETILQVLDMSVRYSIPLLLACLAGLFSERAGMAVPCYSGPQKCNIAFEKIFLFWVPMNT